MIAAWRFATAQRARAMLVLAFAVLAGACGHQRDVLVRVRPARAVYVWPAVVQYDISIVNHSPRAITVRDESREGVARPDDAAATRTLRHLLDTRRAGGAVSRRIEAGDSLTLRRDVERSGTAQKCVVTPLLPPGDYETTLQVPYRADGARSDVLLDAECSFVVQENREVPPSFHDFLGATCACRDEGAASRRAAFRTLDSLALEVLASTTQPDIVIALAENLIGLRPEWTAARADIPLYLALFTRKDAAARRCTASIFSLCPSDQQRLLYDKAVEAAVDTELLDDLRMRLR